VKDIPGLIQQDCANYGDSGDVDGTGSHVTVDTARRYQLLYRYKYICHSLRPFGYNFDFHPQFAARLVNIHVLFGISILLFHLNIKSRVGSWEGWLDNNISSSCLPILGHLWHAMQTCSSVLLPAI